MIIEALKKYSQEDESLRGYQQDNKQKSRIKIRMDIGFIFV